MTLNQLKYLVTINECGNITLASKKLNLSQPSLTMQIKKLEDELGVKIFNRRNKPFVITELGQKIISQAKKVLLEEKKINDIINQDKEIFTGKLKIGITPSLVSSISDIIISSFEKKFKNVELVISEVKSEDITNAIEESDIDVGITPYFLKTNNIIEQPLFYEPFVVYLPENHRLKNIKKLNIDDFEFENLLFTSESSISKQVSQLFKGLNLNYTKIIESQNLQTYIDLSDKGHGVVIVPFLNSLKFENKSSQFKEFSKPVPARQICLISLKSEPKKTLTQILKKNIISNLRGKIPFGEFKLLDPQYDY